MEALLRRCINIDLGKKKVILTVKMEIEENKEKDEDKINNEINKKIVEEGVEVLEDFEIVE